MRAFLKLHLLQDSIPFKLATKLPWSGHLLTLQSGLNLQKTFGAVLGTLASCQCPGCMVAICS